MNKKQKEHLKKSGAELVYFAARFSVHRLVEEGPTGDKIALCADAYDVDMVVLGAGPVEKHFVGTTTDKILTRVSRPLLTVKI